MEIKNVALYARVSTNQQDSENQLIELRRYCKARGWSAIEFVDNGFSGSLEEDKRPALKASMNVVRRRQVDAMIVWDFSRFARSMRQLVQALDMFRDWGVSFISLREGIDTSTANGRLVFGIFASLAEFERELIRERVNLGIKRARAEGKQLGRPKTSVDLVNLRQMQQDGRTVREIASALSIGKSTVSKLLSVKPLSNLSVEPVREAA
jgi:DNA invertase Pin-like site-specific DNA recombinase